MYELCQLFYGCINYHITNFIIQEVMHITFIVRIYHGAPAVNNIMWMCMLSLDVTFYVFGT